MKPTFPFLATEFGQRLTRVPYQGLYPSHSPIVQMCFLHELMRQVLDVQAHDVDDLVGVKFAGLAEDGVGF
jgi:hypothetical protein